MPYPLKYTIETIMGGNDRTVKRGVDDILIYAVYNWRAEGEDPFAEFVHVDRDECVKWLRTRGAPKFPTDTPTDSVTCPECDSIEVTLMCTGDFWWQPKQIDDDGNLIFSCDRGDECNNDNYITCLDCKMVWSVPDSIDFT